MWVFSSCPFGDPADDDPEWAEPPKIGEKVEEMPTAVTGPRSVTGSHHVATALVAAHVQSALRQTFARAEDAFH